jgi:hypothetical protein
MLGPMKTSYLALLALSAFSPAAAQSLTSPAAALPVATPSRAASPTQLSGTVLTGAGRPLAGVNVFLKTTFDGATTDSLGRFAFTTTAAGTLPLVCTLMGYELQEMPLTLPAAGGPLTLPPRRLRESRASLASNAPAVMLTVLSEARLSRKRRGGRASAPPPLGSVNSISCSS